MKAAIIAILALSALSVAWGVTVTAYSDGACATLSANPILGIANPSVGPINTCIKSYTISGSTFYVKYSACTATASAANTYSDAACTVARGGITADVPGTCIPVVPAGDLPGVGSYKVACSSAASATLAFVSVAAATLALYL